MLQERFRLMAKVCQLYFVEGLNQQAIADHYGISRTQVSRLISAAKTEGIVEINIRHPFGHVSEMEKELVKHFQLTDVVLVDTNGVDELVAEILLAQAGAAYLENIIKNEYIIGVMAGKSIANLAQEMTDISKKNLQFVPMIGGWGSEGTDWHANANTTRFAKNVKGSHWLLNAPAIVSSNDIRNHLIQEPEILKIKKLFQKIDVALIGIGEISECATFVQSTNMGLDQLRSILDKGAVASICTSLINANGEEIDTVFAQQMIGISSEELKHIPNVIGTARGEHKVDAILAAVRGKWIDVLVTDLNTAKKMLEQENINI
ncbi:sugar-binding transcriptional regulator [Alkalihalobacterium alkalinitrilicum]|uniref:sugar-binding transcriptional regulator n=1 Tax=Alkalihalobacterium alkalinitrilicum TaxID=427920 RepID=UPI000994A64D|nr:sugar-binding transcriptional regulator [Alkalihalobacterium alkalinitrilicum]